MPDGELSHRATSRLDGKVALVTGAGRGLGRTAALALAEAGADVALGARSADALDAVAAEVRVLGSRALVVPVDVTDSTQVDAFVDAAVSEFGHIDILVNNSGAAPPTPILDTSDEDWDALVALNLGGVFAMTRAAGRHLVAQRSGKVINIASNFALIGVPGFAGYCSTKAAVIALTRVVAMEWVRYGVQVNALAPGYFETDMNAAVRADAEMHERVLRSIPTGRMGTPDELKPWIVNLASSASDFMTGATVVIDGGQSVR